MGSAINGSQLKNRHNNPRTNLRPNLRHLLPGNAMPIDVSVQFLSPCQIHQANSGWKPGIRPTDVESCALTAQELCESRGGTYGFCGRKATLQPICTQKSLTRTRNQSTGYPPQDENKLRCSVSGVDPRPAQGHIQKLHQPSSIVEKEEKWSVL